MRLSGGESPYFSVNGLCLPNRRQDIISYWLNVLQSVWSGWRRCWKQGPYQLNVGQGSVQLCVLNFSAAIRSCCGSVLRISEHIPQGARDSRTLRGWEVSALSALVPSMAFLPSCPHRASPLALCVQTVLPVDSSLSMAFQMRLCPITFHSFLLWIWSLCLHLQSASDPVEREILQSWIPAWRKMTLWYCWGIWEAGGLAHTEKNLP